MKNTKVNLLVNKILEGRSVREALMQATIKDPVTGKYVDVDFENPWDKSSDKSFAKSSDNSFNVSDIFDYAILLSIEEYRKYISNIPEFVDGRWWLRSPGKYSDSASYVDVYGEVHASYYNVCCNIDCVRPALHFKAKNPYSIGDSFRVGDYDFTVISKDYAFCDGFIGESPFRQTFELKRMYDKWEAVEISDEEFYEYCDSIHANDYEYSDVKKIVDKWFNKNKGEIIEML